MDSLTLLHYGGLIALVALLVIFELMEGNLGARGAHLKGYEYWSAGQMVRIHKAFGSLYKIYVFDPSCPVPTSRDRFGTYFTLRASSAPEVELQVNAILEGGSNE